MGNQQNKGGGFFDESSQKGEYIQIKDQISKTCKCSLKTRILGWMACFVIGWILSLLASFVLVFSHNHVKFAILYSIGQVINITGSCFLATPKTQIKDMCKKTRWVLSLVYILSIIATMLLAFLLDERYSFVVFIMLVVQIISYYLYTFSFVPFGRRILKSCCKCLLL